MTSLAYLRVCYLVGRRNVLNVARIPGNVVTVVGLPVLVLIMFSGAFAGLTALPGFPARDSLTWVTPYAVAMGAVFTGLGSAFNVARDVANGFMTRLLVSAAPQSSLILGEVAGSIGRALLQLAAVLVIALPAGLSMPGGAAASVALLLLASAGIATWSGLLALAIMYRLRSAQAIGLVSAVVLAVGLLSTGSVPLSYQSGWLHMIARLNPLTEVLGMSRQGFVGPVTRGGTWPGVVVLAAVTLALLPLAWTGLRRLGP